MYNYSFLGFKGDYCEIMEDPCMVPRCNFGTCVPTDGVNFKCLCQPGYSGMFQNFIFIFELNFYCLILCLIAWIRKLKSLDRCQPSVDDHFMKLRI